MQIISFGDILKMYFFLLPFLLPSVINCQSFLLIKNEEVTIGNELFNVTFNANATAKSLYKNGVNLLANIPKKYKTWYLDWDGETQYFRPDRIEVIKNVSEQVHVRYVQEARERVLRLEYNMLVFPNKSGLYQYVKASNPTNATVSLAELRIVYRFDHGLMTKLTNMVRSGETPDSSNRPNIQDATSQLADGSYYTKYDFCGYIRETPWMGVFGGGFGGWLVSASREYHSGGPLKQDLLVHQNSLMLNYFQSTHFGTPSLRAFSGWSKFYGPFLIYINTGDEDEVQADAARQAREEAKLWPYQWVDDQEYPLSRGIISGQVTGQPKAMIAVYDSVEEQFDLQTLGYLYHAETNETGHFTISNIRPGQYQVVAYPLAGHGSENLAKKNITVIGGETINIGSLCLPEPSNILWSIGEVNRRSDEFRFSHELRNFYWQYVVPKNHTYTINHSRPDHDWYFMQPKGIWKILYNDTNNSKPRVLRIGVAAASGSLIFNYTSVSLRVDFNNFTVGAFQFDNDRAIYRSALQSGNYSSEIILVPEDLVVTGTNVISLEVLQGSIMYDAISLGFDGDVRSERD